MEEALNGTIDPACLQEPPLALDVIRQLDVFEFCLYSILTVMSCISLLLYLEQCVYIYKKLPYPKRTTIIWISGAAPVIATMSCFGLWIPRAVLITDMTSNCYFSVAMYKVLVLIVEEFGGRRAFLKRFSGEDFRINTGPCCCYCCCLPRLPMSRRFLFLLKLGALLYAILKITLSVVSVVLWTNGNFDPSDLDITGAVIWINPFLGVFTLTSIWSVAIVFMNTNSFLRKTNIIPKYAMYQLVLVLSQLQTSVMNILALDGTIACAPPFSSQARGSLLNQQMMIMEMFIITLVNWFLFRRTYDTLPTLPCGAHDNDKNCQVEPWAALVEHDV